MKSPALRFAALLATIALAGAAEPAVKPAGAASAATMHDLRIGEVAPDFALRGVDGQTHTLAEFGGAKVLMIAFLSNHCPDSHAAEGRIKQLVADMKGKSFALVAINPNNPDGMTIDELGYSKYDDSFDAMKQYAADSGFTFPYLDDGGTQAVAKAYGCLATPHMFIFDAARKLRYKGQFDDSRFADAATVKSPDGRNAVEAMLADQPVPVEVTKPHGCSTKWLEKKPGALAQIEKWDQTPVDLEKIEASGVAALRQNGTKRLRLFNVWSTTCGPCVAEFPELVKIARQFDMRDFQFITLSTDDPQDLGKAKAFLEKRGAGLSSRAKNVLKAENRTTNSYLFQGADVSEMMKALDPEWPGGFPHTVLIGTRGEVLWRHNGPVDAGALRGKLIDFLGVYYTP